MAVPIEKKTHQDALNDANPNIIPSALQKARIGDVLRSQKTALRRQAPVADATVAGATLQVIKLHDKAKAVQIVSAYARSTSAAGPLGNLAIAAAGAAPTTGQIGIAANGDITVLAADAYTSVDVIYQPDHMDVMEVEVPVASNLAAIPQSLLDRSVVSLLAAEAVTGTSVGKKLPMTPGTTSAAGQAALNAAKTSVLFAVADAVTRAKLKIGVASLLNLDEFLKSDSTLI